MAHHIISFALLFAGEVPRALKVILDLGVYCIESDFGFESRQSVVKSERQAKPKTTTGPARVTSINKPVPVIRHFYVTFYRSVYSWKGYCALNKSTKVAMEARNCVKSKPCSLWMPIH